MSADRLLYSFLACTLLVGAWHGLPVLNQVHDEMYYVGGPLRAMEARSIAPAPGDVPYGTLTYFLNYGAFGLLLLVLYAASGFDLEALRAVLVESKPYLYMVPRLVSAGIGLGFVLLYGRMLAEAGVGGAMRRLLLFLLFSTMLVSTLFHTGKVWILSTFLVFLSFYFVWRTLRGDAGSARWSAVAAFAAAANFPLAGFSLIAIPILGVASWTRREIARPLAAGIGLGLLVSVAVMAINGGGIWGQVSSIVNDYTLSDVAVSTNLAVGDSLLLNAARAAAFFPLLLLLAAAAAFRPSKDRCLSRLALAYAVIYFLAISVVARWSTGLHSFVRYLFPLPFFIVAYVAGKDVRFKAWHWPLAAVSGIFLMLTLSHLSVPTTHNLAADWVLEWSRGKKVLVLNRVGPDFNLPQTENIEVSDEYLGERSGGRSNGFGRVVIVDWRELEGKRMVAAFANPVPDDEYYNADKIGDYFDPVYWRLDRLGRNLYIYEHTTDEDFSSHSDL